MRIIDIILSITILISSAVNTIIGKDNKLMNYSENKLNELEIYNSIGLEKFIFEKSFESLINKSNNTLDDKSNFEEDLIDENLNNNEDENKDLDNEFNNIENWNDNKTYNVDPKEEEKKSVQSEQNYDVLRVVKQEYPQSWNDKLYLEECNYKETKNYDNTYGYLIGKNSTSVGDLYGEYEYATAMILGASAKYPNIFILDKSYGLEDKSALSFRTSDESIRFVINSKKITSGLTAETVYNEETKGRNVVESKIDNNKVEYYIRIGNMGYYKIISLECGRISYFIYEFPDKYKDILNPMLEESKKSFQVFNGYPEEIK